MYNKKRYEKDNKKILHKVKKQWAVISLTLFLLIGESTIATHFTTFADSLSNNRVTEISRSKFNQNSSINITNKKALRVGSHHSQSNSHILRDHYRRSNNHHSLKKSWYQHKDDFIFNKYAPNSRRAVIPKRVNLRHLKWAKGRFGKLNLKLFIHKHNGWITLNAHSTRKYRNSLKAIYRKFYTTRDHTRYVSHHKYNKYIRQLSHYRYSMQHGSRWTRKHNKHAYYSLKGRMKYMKIKKAKKHYLNITDTTRVLNHKSPYTRKLFSNNRANNNTHSSNDQFSSKKQINITQIMKDIKEETLNDINNERQANGVRTLTENSSLNRLANMRAQQASINFTHYDPNGNTYIDKDAKQLGINLHTAWAENIADNYGNNGAQVADNANNNMMNRDANSNWGHRYNILDPNMKHIGIGVAPSQGKYQGDFTITEDFTN